MVGLRYMVCSICGSNTRTYYKARGCFWAPRPIFYFQCL